MWRSMVGLLNDKFPFLLLCHVGKGQDLEKEVVQERGLEAAFVRGWGGAMSRPVGP